MIVQPELLAFPLSPKGPTLFSVLRDTDGRENSEVQLVLLNALVEAEGEAERHMPY